MSRALFVLAVLLCSPFAARAQTCTTVPPAAPIEVTVTRVSTGVTVSWKDGTTTATCRATRFYLEVSQNGQNVREFAIAPQGESLSQQLVQVPDVPFGGLWRFSLKSFNPVGLSPQVSAYINDISGSCFAMPDPVTQIVASASGRLVTVQWLHPGSCTLTGFVIEAAASADGPAVYSESFQNPAMRSFSATAPPGTWYIRVYAESHRRLTAASPWAGIIVQ